LLMQDCEYDFTINKATQKEYLHSDIISFGNKVLSLREFAREYPEWYKYWLPYSNSIQCSRFIVAPDYEFGTSGLLNAIYEIDEENAKAKYLMSFPVDDKHPWLYHTSIRIGNKLLYVPARARCWMFYDLESCQWTYEEVPKDLHPSNEWRGAFGGWTVFGNELIFLPGESGAIAKYNIDTGKITYHKEWYSKFRSNVTNVNWGIINSILSYYDSLLLVSSQVNMIIELDPKTVSVKKMYKVGDDDCGFRTGCLIPKTDTVYLIRFRDPQKTQWTETIIKWNIKSGDVKEITSLPIKPIENHTQNLLCGFVFWKGELFVTPLQGDSILKIDLQTDTVNRYPLTPEFDFFERKSKYYEGWGKDQALPYVFFNGKRMKYMAQLPYDYGLADIDFSNSKILNRRKWYVEGVEELIKTKDIKHDAPLVEGAFITLEKFLDQLDSEEFLLENKNRLAESCGEMGDLYGTSGQKIFEYVKKLAGV